MLKPTWVMTVGWEMGYQKIAEAMKVVVVDWRVDGGEWMTEAGRGVAGVCVCCGTWQQTVLALVGSRGRVHEFGPGGHKQLGPERWTLSASGYTRVVLDRVWDERQGP